MRRKDDKPPQDHWKKRFPELEKELLDTYYRHKGWNNNGIPTKESLHDFGLDYVFEDLEKRGVYSENGDAPPAEGPAQEGKGVQP
jgi:hypothetical protein